MSLTKLHHFFCNTCTVFWYLDFSYLGCSQSETSDSAYANLDTLDVSIGYWNIEDMSNIQKDAMRDYVEKSFRFQLIRSRSTGLTIKIIIKC